MELFAALFGMSVATFALAAVAVGLVFPLFWLWMLVDALVRDPSGFPGQSDTDKLVWILAMVLVNVAAFAYWVMVYRRGSVPAGAPVTVSPAATAA